MKPLENLTIDAEWLRDERLQQLFDVLCRNGGEARVAGGAVRNHLIGEPVSDVDLCTTLLPEDVVLRLAETDMKAVPTGIEHGTITVVTDGAHYEVTTLREDVETNGRHAVVKFGTDWQRDAERRDLTINALYCDRDGRIFDPLGGYADVQAREVRFIGDASQRIKEDALRILRFFRFFACYGGGRPDASGLKACAANKGLISTLSAERVWMELKKILAAPDPGRALLWMRTTGILDRVLPESEKWGIDAIPALIRLETQHGWMQDPMVRLMSIMRPHLETIHELAKRLAFSNKEVERMEHWAQSAIPPEDTSEDELAEILYWGSKQGIIDAMRIKAALMETGDVTARLEELISHINFAEKWQRPILPVQGRDLLDLGMAAGPQMGEKLAQLENAWLKSGFKLSKEDLLAM